MLRLPKHHRVDIGRVIQAALAVLAQGEDEQSGRGIVRILDRKPAGPRRGFQRRTHGGVGEVGDGADGVFQAEGAGEVGQRGRQMHVGLGLTQGRHACVGIRARAARLGIGLGQDNLRRFDGEPAQRVRPFQSEAPEIRRRGEDRV
jgi:hypothetical protein